jgi:hypothetical protein
MQLLTIWMGAVLGRRRVVEAYLHGIHWVLEYYYRGVASWNWCVGNCAHGESILYCTAHLCSMYRFRRWIL